MSWWLRRSTHPKSNPQQTTPLHRRPVTEPLGDDEEAKCPAGPAADGQIWPEQSPEVNQCLPNTGILCDQNSFWNRVHLSVIDNSWVPKETAKMDNAKASLLPSSFQSRKCFSSFQSHRCLICYGVSTASRSTWNITVLVMTRWMKSWMQDRRRKGAVYPRYVRCPTAHSSRHHHHLTDKYTEVW